MDKKEKIQHRCVICKIKPSRSDKARTCDQHCAGKLAWETRTE